MSNNCKNTVTLVIKGLRHPDRDDQTYDATLQIDRKSPLRRIWEDLGDLGYSTPNQIQTSNKKKWGLHSTRSVFHPSKKVEVVSEKSAADETHVWINEPLAACSNRGQTVSFEITSGEEGDYGDIHANSLGIDGNLALAFHRTVRMPDDDRLHSLPASAGYFPLYNVVDYADRMPDSMLEKGGLFLPMWQREALWISFHTTGLDQPYAIRIYVGHINAVTGDNMMDKKPPADGRPNPQQDYIIVPGQKWIDGVCVAPGVVRQFVAMPLGSGYTVEGQKTGEEKHGGLQIEIIPSYRRGLAKWLRTECEEALRYHHMFLDESNTPAELHLKPGDTILSYPPDPGYTRPSDVGDLLDEDDATQEDDLLSVEVVYHDLVIIPGQRSAPGHSNIIGSNYFSMGSASSAPSMSEIQYGGPSTASTNDASRVIQYASDLETLSTRGMKNDDRPQENLPERQPLNVKAMGLAAGGKLIQDIYRDHNPPTMWNVDAARVFHVHILDPASCEAVTHIVPPPIPMGVYDALVADLPFFVVEEQVDNRVEGGDFDNVKSVSQMDKTKEITSEPSFDPSQLTMCKSCEKRLCDCIVRPCDHQFCNVCIRVLEQTMEGSDPTYGQCPRCNEQISRVVGFSAPMNLPGEETNRTKMPVRILKVDDGKIRFQSVRQTRI